VPRQRRARSQSNESDNESERVVKKMAGLTAEQIQALLGKTRQKGQYLELLNKFIESGEMGVNVQDTWVELRDKQPSTIKQGFEGAKDKKEAAEGAELVKVITNKEGEGDSAVTTVYLINMAIAGQQIEVPEAA
jgi:hypothetical protein